MTSMSNQNDNSVDKTELTVVCVCQTSLKSKLVKWLSPEERTIYSESSRHGDFINDFGIGLASNTNFKKIHQKIGN